MLKKIEKDIILISYYSVKRKYKLLKNYLYAGKFRKKEKEKIYEAVLQSYLLAGFPSALVTLKILNEFFQVPLIKNNNSNKINYYEIGRKNLVKVYGNKTDRLLSNIKSFSPEMSFWLVEEGYGKVFSRKSLSIRERELGFCTILIALKFEDQLISHLLGAMRNNVSLSELKELIELLSKNNFKKDAEFGERVLNFIFLK